MRINTPCGHRRITPARSEDMSESSVPNGLKLSMTVDTRTLAVYRKVSKKSDYVGTVSELKQVAALNAVVKPVTDSVSVELYGERVHGMLTISTTDKDTLKVGDIVKCDGADYKILSVAHYTMHDSATAERT